MFPDGLAESVEVLAPASVLRRLAEVAAPGERPEVSVHLAGGQVIDGLPVRAGSDRGQEVVLLADARAGRLRYVLLAAVVALEVREPERVQDVLSGGRLPAPIAGDPPSRLALRRDFAPTEEFPVQVDWAAVPDGGPPL